MERRYASFCAKGMVAAAAAFWLAGVPVSAQLNIVAPNTAYTVNFDGTVAGVANGAFNGTGFQPAPTAGRLDSDAWAITGWSDGDLAFGGTRITSGTDYRRGASAVAVTTGGIYSFTGAGITGNAFGIQPGGADWAPGTMTLRMVNNTGSTLTQIAVSYNAYYRDDQGRSSSFNFSYSSDNASYTAVGALDVVSPVGPGGAAWVQQPRSTTITGLFIPNGASFYIRWSGADVGGAGSRDEFALDDIVITAQAYTMVRLTASSSSASEDAGTTTVTASIVNPDPVIPTTVDLALTSGPAARIDNYTTQTLSFPGGSLANQSATITISDNGACDGDATLGFQLQNVAGGNNSSIGSPSTHTLTITDNETEAASFVQNFDNGGVDGWVVTAGAGAISSNTGGSDFPASQRVLSAPASWQVINGTATLDLTAVSTLDWSNVVITARLSSTSTSGTNGADGSDDVRFFVNINGGGFPVTPDITVAGNTNARWGYATGTGVASGTAGTPASFAPAGGGDRTTDGYSTVQISVPGNPTSVALRVVALNNNAAEIWNIEDVQITGTLCQPIYFSRASGSEASATWSTSRTGSPAPAAVTFNKNASMVVQSGHVVTTTGANFDVRDLVLETGSSMTLGGTTTLGVNGTECTADGGLVAANDHIKLLFSAAGTLGGITGTLAVNDLTVDGGDVTLGFNTLNITGTLQVDSGDFNANGNAVVLVSNTSGTARLGPVGVDGSYTGNITMQRYIPGGVTDWRLLASPVSGLDFNSWKDDFFTAGFPGSNYPPFYVNNVLWPSIREYDETNTGALSSDGLIGIGNITDAITVGQGFAAYSGTTLGGTTPFTIDMIGAPTVAATPFTLPMTWTNTGNAAVDGLNLVGNPLPSPIDFSLISLGADVDNFYYIYKPGAGTNAVWDETNSLGTLGTNGNIQSSQAFWLHATGAALTTTVSESAKVLEPSAGGIFSQQVDDRPKVRLRLNNTANDFVDEAIVHFISGDPATGASDIAKFPFVHPEAVSIATLSTNGDPMTINAYGTLTSTYDIPVEVDVQVDGDFAITSSDLGELAGTACLVLEDLQTGISTNLSEGAVYTFSMNAADPVTPARFVLHVSVAASREATALTCAGANDGAITVAGTGTGPWDYVLADAFGTVLAQELGATGSHVFGNLAPGSYQVAVNGSSSCGAISAAVVVDSPLPLAAAATATGATCAASADGGVNVDVQGGTAPYTYAWSNGDLGEDLVNVPAGSYTLALTDANGCAYNMPAAVVFAGAGPVATFTPSATTVLVNEQVEFFNASTSGAFYTWDFGDGQTSNDAEPTHLFTLPGLFNVTLTVEEGDCVAQHTEVIAVSTSTGVTELSTDGVLAWTEGGQFVVQWQGLEASGVQVDLLDAAGRVVAQDRAQGTMGRMTIDGQRLPTGVYLLRLVSGDAQRTVRLPLVR
ncbi:MAG: PKD domain-containing protein [Flavobacteriales bacterium]|nr:PKD domain-containing protein [Flavobacteriales bacterium]